MSKWIESAIPEPTVLLGRELKPLTIGHCLLLERFECEPVDSIDSLVFAVVICSHAHDEVLDVLADPWYKWKMRLWRFRLGGFDWSEKLKLWSEYFKQHCEAPTVISTMDNKGDGHKESGTPFLQHLKVYLMSKLGYSLKEALECVVTQGIWDMYTHAEIEGTIRIVDKEKVDDLKKLAEDNMDEIKKAMEAHQTMLKKDQQNAP